MLALLRALPWLLLAAAPGHPAKSPRQLPAPRRAPRDPARGADFDRVYTGVVSLSTENIFSFNYTSRPGQDLPDLRATSLLGSSRGIDLGRPRGPGDVRSLLLRSNHCAARAAATRLGGSSASPRASLAWSRAFLGLAEPPVPRAVCGSWLPAGLLSRKILIPGAAGCGAERAEGSRSPAGKNPHFK
ncbi:hypothetical protein P7K49_031228 [Saguinus oedipus]|uniref:Uncharacterized protein n=1 Tax=Saguinus oedipus TaxID=9490 RepID=A0ABQ9U599_SAGOE|nr:hypothetical protein P7K49_031228 [Saguinus oedipus]